MYSPQTRALLRSGRHGNVSGPQWLIKGTDTMLAPGAAPAGAVGDPTTPHKVLRGVLQPGDKPPARALAQITSGRAGYHLGLAMLCLTQWIKPRWPSTGIAPWIWAIPTARTQMEAGPETGTDPPPGPQHPLTCEYYAIHNFLCCMDLSPPLQYPLPTTDQEVHQICTLICEILAAAAEDGKLLLQNARPTSNHTGAPLQADTYTDATHASPAPHPPTQPPPLPLPPHSPPGSPHTPTITRSPGPRNTGLLHPSNNNTRPPQTLPRNTPQHPTTRQPAHAHREEPHAPRHTHPTK